MMKKTNRTAYNCPISKSVADGFLIKSSMVSIIPNSNKVQFGYPRLQKYAGR